MTRNPAAAGLAAAVALLAAAPAWAADVPGNASTRATLSLRSADGTYGELERPGDVDWYRVRLVAGRDYGVVIDEVREFPTVFLTVRDPRGRAIRTVEAFGLGDNGLEIRAATTGDHFVEVSYRPEPGSSRTSDSYRINVTTDCRDANTTRCALQVGRPYNGRSLWSTDRDRFALTLDRSRSYTFTLTAPADFIGGFIEVYDGRGRLAARTFGSGEIVIRGFRPAASGRHHLRVNVGEDYGDRYTLLAVPD
jgi:hypothetical protein